MVVKGVTSLHIDSTKTDPAPPGLVFSNLSIAYPNITQHLLLENLSVHLNPGDFMLLEGPNGSGKTTFLHVLAGFEAPASGTIALDGINNQHDLSFYQSQVGWLGHDNGLRSELTIQENLALFAALYQTASSDIESALDYFALTRLRHVPVGRLSAGQARRVALARLELLKMLPLWLMDEPLNALDRAATDLWRDQVRRYRAEGGIVIIATHGDCDIDPTHHLHLGNGAAGVHQKSREQKRD